MIEGDTAQKTAEAEKAAGELLARSAAREIHTENFAEDHAQISDLATEYGGYLMRDSVSGAEGAQTAQIEAAIGGRVQTHRFAAFELAFNAAVETAKSGDTVLLSPACTAFDQFRDFEERGAFFCTLVKNLK